MQTYIEKGNLINAKDVLNYINTIDSIHLKKRIEKKLSEMNYPVTIESLADQLVEINDCLFAGRPVFATVEKSPSSLDRGAHYYSLWYIRANYELVHFWFPPLMEHMKNGGYPYAFKSGALGMSRIIDATDDIFTLIKNCGGCYAQIDAI